MKIRTLTFVLLFASLLSCREEEVLPDGEINARKFEELVDNRQVILLYIRWSLGGSTRSATYEDPLYRIEGSFLKVENDYYNLAKLQKITDWGSGRFDLELE